MKKVNTKKFNLKNLFKANPDRLSKRNLKKSWLIVGGAGVIAALGIGVPVGIVNNTTVQAPPLNPGETGVTFRVPDNSGSITFSIGRLIDESRTKSSVHEKTFQNFNLAIASLLYSDEYALSQAFAKAWEKSSVSTATFTDFPKLDSLADIASRQSKVLNDEKLNIQQRFGFTNWQSEWNKILATSDKYGKTGTEEGALDFLVLSQIRTNANRRFTARIITTFDQRHLNATVTEDIFFEQDVPSLGIKAGDKYLSRGDKILQNFFDKDQPNGRLANYVVNTASIATNKPVAVFATSSFLNFLPASQYGKYFSTEDILKQNLDQYKTLYNVSHFVIPGIAPATDITGNWQVTKENLQSILSYGVVNDKVLSLLDDEAIFKFNGTSLLSNETVSDENKNKIALDSFFLATRSVNTNKAEHGLLAFGSLNSIFAKLNPTTPNMPGASPQPQSGLVTLALALDGSQTTVPNTNLVYTSIPNSENPLIKLRNALRTNDVLKKEIYDEIDKLGPITRTNIIEANNIIVDKLAKLSTDDFQRIINTSFNSAFVVGDDFNKNVTTKFNDAKPNQRKLNYYDSVNDLWIVLDEKGINVIKRQTFTKLEEYNKYIINDLYHSFNRTDVNRINFASITELARFNNEINNTNAMANQFLKSPDSEAYKYIEKYFADKNYTTSTVSFTGEISNLRTYLTIKNSEQLLTQMMPILDTTQKLVVDSLSNDLYVDFLNNSKFTNNSAVVTQEQVTREWLKLILTVLTRQLGVRDVQITN